jgi:hypothetical protein
VQPSSRSCAKKYVQSSSYDKHHAIVSQENGEVLRFIRQIHALTKPMLFLIGSLTTILSMSQEKQSLSPFIGRRNSVNERALENTKSIFKGGRLETAFLTGREMTLVALVSGRSAELNSR